MRLNPSTAAEGAVWRVDLQDRSIRTNGYLTLQGCAAGCTLPPGLYGRIAQGEAVLEYQGGRSVLRGRSFHWPSANTRPEVLAQPPALLDDNASQLEGTRVRTEVATTLQSALEGTENRISVSRRDYIESVRAYNTEITTIPGRRWKSFMYPTSKEMATFDIPAEEQKVPKVDFNKK